MYLEGEEEVLRRENMMGKEYPLASIKRGQLVVSPASLGYMKSDFSVIVDMILTKEDSQMP